MLITIPTGLNLEIIIKSAKKKICSINNRNQTVRRIDYELQKTVDLESLHAPCGNILIEKWTLGKSSPQIDTFFLRLLSSFSTRDKVVRDNVQIPPPIC